MEVEGGGAKGRGEARLGRPITFIGHGKEKVRKEIRVFYKGVAMQKSVIQFVAVATEEKKPPVRVNACVTGPNRLHPALPRDSAKKTGGNSLH